MDIVCPQCGEADDLAGRSVSGTIELTCGACGQAWLRDLSARCRTCGGADLQTVPLAILEKARGTQLSVIGTRPVDLCSACDAARLRHYHRYRPHPLMPDELPTIGKVDET